MQCNDKQNDKLKKRNTSILTVLDSVHHSILLNNLKYEGGNFFYIISNRINC